jgi:hypothetical protein
MATSSDDILCILDRCCDAYTFPMLDNGYIYLAATRLSLFRSISDWAIVIEVFGYSPRAGLPDTCVQNFASSLYDRNPPERYVNREAYERYLANHPHNDSRPIFPIHEGQWQDADNVEFVARDAHEVVVRNQVIPLPGLEEYVRLGIELEHAPRVQVYELCRFLADMVRQQVLATPLERRVSVLPEMKQICN